MVMNTARTIQIPHSAPTTEQANKPRVLDLIRNTCRVKGYSHKTADCYCDWVRRFSQFHHKRPLSEMGGPEMEEFLTHLAVKGNVAASTQNQAFNAIRFFYTHVFPRDLGKIDAVRAKKPKRLPEVFSKSEVTKILLHLYGTGRLMGRMLYGCGLRLNECLNLRVKDIDFERMTVTIREGKGNKDRVVPLPKSMVEPIQAHLKQVAEQHRQDVAEGIGVSLPGALAKKYPSYPFSWAWYWVFPARKACTDPRWASPEQPLRYHIHETVLQKAVKHAVRKSGISSPGGCHTFRHSYATHLLEDGYNVRQVQELLGHVKLETTMVYLHVMGKTVNVVSPLDGMEIE
jgi:integron integrase